MNRQENPFASPAESDRVDRYEDAPLSRPQQKRLEVGEVVVAWEKRRVWYNAVLTGVVLLVSPLLLSAFLSQAAARVSLSEAVVGLLACVVGANGCYLAGPVVEGYATWLLGPIPWLRNVLFIVGTLFSILLTLLVCVGFMFSLSNM